MKKKPRYAKQSAKAPKTVIVLSCVAAALLLLVIVMLLLIPKGETPPEESTGPAIETTTESTAPDTSEGTSEGTATETTEETTVPEETEPVMLVHMQALYDQNPDIIGWVKIEGTKINYPVMHTPEDGEKYLYRDFDGNYKVAGSLFLKDVCSMDPESDNLIIYGHNMKNGSMFHGLTNYADEEFYEEHRYIYYTTLYEERVYEVIAVLKDRVYKKTDTNFKFYQFVNAESEEDWDVAMTYFAENSIIDTGITAEYGDNLITLVTCAYHVKNGRFVVIAKEIDPAEVVTTEVPSE